MLTLGALPSLISSPCHVQWCGCALYREVEIYLLCGIEHSLHVTSNIVAMHYRCEVFAPLVIHVEYGISLACNVDDCRHVVLHIFAMQCVVSVEVTHRIWGHQ